MKQTLRYYQKEANDAIIEDFKTFNKILLILPTGCGKTTVFSEVIDYFYKKGLRVLVIAHRQELLLQARERIYTFTRYMPEIDMAEKKPDRSANIILASVQTLRDKRLKAYPNNHFDLIVVDEAHHSSANSYKNIIDYFDCKVLGVTATPDRADEKELGDIYEKVSYQYSLVKAIKEGFLANIRGFQIKDFEIDLSNLRKATGKDFTDGQVESVIMDYIEPIAGGIASEGIRNLKSIVFLPTVNSAKVLSHTLNEIGVKAKYISGESSKEDRDRTLQEFKEGEFTHLLNCAVLTEGFDEPSIQNVVIARPTKSRTLYAQMTGRGTRLHDSKLKDANGKPYMYLTEFSYSNTQHRLVKPYELFSSKGFDERVRNHAEKNSSGDYLNDLEKSHDYYHSVKNVLSRVTVKTREGLYYDPFAVADLCNVDLTGEFEVKYEGRVLAGSITEKQIELLRKLNINEPEKLDKAQASRLIDTIAQNGWKVEKIIKKVMQG